MRDEKSESVTPKVSEWVTHFSFTPSIDWHVSSYVRQMGSKYAYKYYLAYQWCPQTMLAFVLPKNPYAKSGAIPASGNHVRCHNNVRRRSHRKQQCISVVSASTALVSAINFASNYILRSCALTLWYLSKHPSGGALPQRLHSLLRKEWRLGLVAAELLVWLWANEVFFITIQLTYLILHRQLKKANHQ